MGERLGAHWRIYGDRAGEAGAAECLCRRDHEPPLALVRKHRVMAAVVGLESVTTRNAVGGGAAASRPNSMPVTARQKGPDAALRRFPGLEAARHGKRW
jgi:hypothetical protein